MGLSSLMIWSVTEVGEFGGPKSVVLLVQHWRDRILSLDLAAFVAQLSEDAGNLKVKVFVGEHFQQRLKLPLAHLGKHCGAKTSFATSKRRLFGLPVTKRSMGFRIMFNSPAEPVRREQTEPHSPGSTNGARSRRLRKGGLNETLQPERV